jgi:trimethylamine:corrinoid methyltransferase-like protein
MDYLFVIPTIACVLYFLVKFLERKYLTNEDDLEKFALKIVFRDAIIIFCTTLTANFIYSNTHNHLDNFFSIITDTKKTNVNATAEIFTDVPNF